MPELRLSLPGIALSRADGVDLVSPGNYHFGNHYLAPINSNNHRNTSLTMALKLSPEDHEFRVLFESCQFPPAEFHHRAHLRLAYVYLADNDTESAYQLMRDALQRFLTHHGIDLSKYHDTMTRAWILAVRHFMAATPDAASADDFIAQHPEMLDANIMMTHYSAELLFSDEARAKFVEPDLDPIPRYNR